MNKEKMSIIHIPSFTQREREREKEIPTSPFNLSLSSSLSFNLSLLLWGHRTGNILSSFVLGLRPMPRPIITCKKGNGDCGNPKVVSRTSSSSASLGRGRRGVIHQQMQSSKASQKKRQVQQVSRLKHGGRTIPGKAAASPLNAPQLTFWPH